MTTKMNIEEDEFFFKENALKLKALEERTNDLFRYTIAWSGQEPSISRSFVTAARWYFRQLDRIPLLEFPLNNEQLEHKVRHCKCRVILHTVFSHWVKVIYKEI